MILTTLTKMKEIVMNKIGLVLTIVLHYVVFVAFLLTCLLSIFNMPWYVALTLDALIFRVIFSRAECPLLSLENYFRKNLLIDASRGFLKDFIINPHKTIPFLYEKLKG